jgi:hypothetical protein
MVIDNSPLRWQIMPERQLPAYHRFLLVEQGPREMLMAKVSARIEAC